MNYPLPQTAKAGLARIALHSLASVMFCGAMFVADANPPGALVLMALCCFSAIFGVYVDRSDAAVEHAPVNCHARLFYAVKSADEIGNTLFLKRPESAPEGSEVIEIDTATIVAWYTQVTSPAKRLH